MVRLFLVYVSLVRSCCIKATSYQACIACINGLGLTARLGWIGKRKWTHDHLFLILLVAIADKVRTESPTTLKENAETHKEVERISGDLERLS